MSAPNTVLDRDALLARVDGDEDLLRAVVAIYDEELPRSLAKLDAALGALDALPIQLAAHTLKGMLLNMSAAEATQIVSALEHEAGEGRLDGVSELRSGLRDALARLDSELGTWRRRVA